jgi:hypothetical protein
MEDAWFFSELIKRDGISRYGKLRKNIDEKVVKRIEFITRMARGESMLTRFGRSVVLPRALDVQFMRDRFMATVTGLDHDTALAN